MRIGTNAKVEKKHVHKLLCSLSSPKVLPSGGLTCTAFVLACRGVSCCEEACGGCDLAELEGDASEWDSRRSDNGVFGLLEECLVPWGTAWSAGGFLAEHSVNVATEDPAASSYPSFGPLPGHPRLGNNILTSGRIITYCILLTACSSYALEM